MDFADGRKNVFGGGDAVVIPVLRVEGGGGERGGFHPSSLFEMCVFTAAAPTWARLWADSDAR